ncbi:MAG: hypothetical protein H7A49_04270 [Akkermansiaceae bacterium]|nr:hypothetical protein [Akkermansiaceae bacterium]
MEARVIGWANDYPVAKAKARSYVKDARRTNPQASFDLFMGGKAMTVRLESMA